MEMVVENRQRQQPVNWTRRYLRLVLKPATFQTYIVNLNVLLCSAAKPTHSRFRFCLIKTRKKTVEENDKARVCINSGQPYTGDEISNVNFLYDDIEHALQNTID